MGQPRSVVAAQTIPLKGDVDANLAAHARFIGAAAKEEAKVIVFPELSLTGYELDLAAELAFTQRDQRLSPLRSLSSTHDMTLIVGAPVRLGEHLHIGAFVVSPDGSLGLYTKRHPGAGEETVIHPGNRSSIAVRHRMAVVFANYGGASGGIGSGGRSAVWSEEGEVVAQLEGLGPGIVVATETVDGWRGRAVDLPGPASVGSSGPLTRMGRDDVDA